MFCINGKPISDVEVWKIEVENEIQYQIDGKIKSIVMNIFINCKH